MRHVATGASSHMEWRRRWSLHLGIHCVTVGILAFGAGALTYKVMSALDGWSARPVSIVIAISLSMMGGIVGDPVVSWLRSTFNSSRRR